MILSGSSFYPVKIKPHSKTQTPNPSNITTILYVLANLIRQISKKTNIKRHKSSIVKTRNPIVLLDFADKSKGSTLKKKCKP